MTVFEDSEDSSSYNETEEYSDYSAAIYGQDFSINYGYDSYGNNDDYIEDASTLKMKRSSNQCNSNNEYCVCEELEAENSEDTFGYFQQICKYNHTTNQPILVLDACYGF